MQAAPEKAEPLAVILDCEIGHNIDNALTLALLHGLSTLATPEAQLLAVSLTRSELQGAAYCDAVGRFYSAIALREFPVRFRRYRGFSVGLDAGDQPGASPALAAALDRKKPDGEPLYEHDVHELVDTADPVALIRNALTAQADAASAVVLAGAATSLAGLLSLNGATKLIQDKARALTMALDPDRALADLPAARRVLAEWPTPIVAISGSKLRFSTDIAFPWADDHPVADALKKAGPDVGTFGMAAALYAARPDAEGFELSEPGRLQLDDSGKLRLEPAADGPHRLLTADAEPQVAAYREIIAAEPAPREPPDFIRRILEREKEEAEKEKQADPTKG